MIKERKPLTMYEAEAVLDSLKETDKSREAKSFIKKFSTMKSDRAEKVKKAIEEFEMLKLREADIIKIVEIAPESAVELNKIVAEASLDEGEINKILDAIKNTK